MTESPASLRYSLIDAFFFSLMVGAGETYLPAYALSIGMSEWLTGLFATMPLIAGALIQLISPWGLRRVKSVKTWVVGSAFLQALAFLPLLYFSIFPTENFLWLFLVAAIYWGAGFAASPTWNYWMGELVPAKEAAQFFARRQRISQLGILLGLVGGGMALHWKIRMGPLTSVFSFLFIIAFAARASSSFFLWLKKDTLQLKHEFPMPSLFSFFRSTHRNFFLFLFVFYVAIYISSPFISPYFLQKLNFNYDQYMLVLACLLFSKMAVLPSAGKLIEKYGAGKVFLIGSLGISPLPLVWQFDSSIEMAVALQLVSGAFWGLFEMGLAMIFFQKIAPEDKIRILTVYNLFSSLAMILGSLIGGQILRSMHASIEGYYWIFGGGAVLRTAIICWYWKKSQGMKFLSAI